MEVFVPQIVSCVEDLLTFEGYAGDVPSGEKGEFETAASKRIPAAVQVCLFCRTILMPDERMHVGEAVPVAAKFHADGVPADICCVPAARQYFSQFACACGVIISVDVPVILSPTHPVFGLY